MSVDFNAITEITLTDVPAGDWPRLMSRLRPAIDPVVERWQRYWQAQEWTVHAQGEPKGFVRIFGPGGFAIVLSPVAAQVYHCSKWDLFATDAEHQQMLRAACFEIARLLGSDRAIYMPELTPHSFFDGGQLQAIEADLRNSFGEPAQTIGEVGERFEPHSYYIDRFHDLRGEAP